MNERDILSFQYKINGKVREMTERDREKDSLERRGYILRERMREI